MEDGWHASTVYAQSNLYTNLSQIWREVCAEGEGCFEKGVLEIAAVQQHCIMASGHWHS
jgi:hypothetical protein